MGCPIPIHILTMSVCYRLGFHSIFDYQHIGQGEKGSIGNAIETSRTSIAFEITNAVIHVDVPVQNSLQGVKGDVVLDEIVHAAIIIKLVNVVTSFEFLRTRVPILLLLLALLTIEIDCPSAIVHLRKAETGVSL